MTKEYLYDVQQGQDRSGEILSMDTEPPFPKEGQRVWYISKAGQVWGGTFLERCYLSPEQYRISDKGSEFDGDHVFTIPMERVFTDRTAAYQQAVEEALAVIESLYDEYEEGGGTALRRVGLREVAPC